VNPIKPSFLRKMLKIKRTLSFSFSNAFELIICHIFAIIHPIKNTKCHFTPHVIPVQMKYKRSHANKMDARHGENEN